MRKLLAALLIALLPASAHATVAAVKVCDGITLTKSTTTDCTVVDLPAAHYMSYQVYCTETTDDSMSVNVDFVNGSVSTSMGVPTGLSQLLTNYATEAAWSSVGTINTPYAPFGTIRFTENNDDDDIVCSAVLMYPTKENENEDSQFSGDSAFLGLVSNAPQSYTIVDTGSDSTKATQTVAPTSSYIKITCSDDDGCTITMGETGMYDGVTVNIVCLGAYACEMDEASGVTVLSGDPVSLGANDSITLRYTGAVWVQIATSDN